MGCDLGQGRLLAPAVPKSSLAAMLRKGTLK
jgi:EAL domain-containing protein (putative c-di-GMP-specific phosphodiesterase class I)